MPHSEQETVRARVGVREVETFANNVIRGEDGSTSGVANGDMPCFTSGSGVSGNGNL